MQHRRCQEETSEDCSLRVCVVGPTCTALTCALTTVSATCWGGYTLQILQTVMVDRCYWCHVRITSNGDTDDSCFHKCFSLGLSCSCVLWQTYHGSNAQTAIFKRLEEMHEFVTNITQTQALTWFLKAVSATCWGSFSGLWFPKFPLKVFFQKNIPEYFIFPERCFDNC